MRCPGCDLFHPAHYETCINCGINLKAESKSEEGAAQSAPVDDVAAPSHSNKRRSKNLNLESRAGTPAFAGVLFGLVIILLAAGATFFFLTRSADDSRLVKKGRVELDKGQYAFAVSTLKKAIEADPSNPRAYLLIARAYVGIDKVDEAWKMVNKAQKLGKGVASEPELASDLANYYRLRKQYEKSIDLIRPLADQNIPGKRAELADLNALAGDEALSDGDLDKALRSWEEVQQIREGSRFGESEARLATIYEKLAKKLASEKKDDEALSYLSKLTAINKNPKHYETSADIYEKSGKLELAIDQLRKALELSNSQRLQRKLATLLGRRGKEMLDNGQTETGYAYLQQARSIDPTSSLPEVTLKKVRVGIDRETRLPMISGEIWNPNSRSIGHLTMRVELYDSRKLDTIYSKETKLVDEFVRPLKAKQSKPFSFISDTPAALDGTKEFKVFIDGSLYKAYKLEKQRAPETAAETTTEQTLTNSGTTTGSMTNNQPVLKPAIKAPNMPPIKVNGAPVPGAVNTGNDTSTTVSPEEKTLQDLDF